MFTLAQALDQRGVSGTPLPTAYHSLAHRGVNFCRGQLSLLVGPPSAGKSLLAFNLIERMKVPTLAFLLDTTELTASARFASIITGDDYRLVKERIIDGDSRYRKELATNLPDIRVVFKAPGLDDVQRHLDAYEQRFGLPPDLILIDNLGNQSSGYENEWATLKAMTLELDEMARAQQCAIVAAHHTTDMTDSEPAARDKILGKVTQYPRLVLSVGYNSFNGEFKVGIVKNSEGKTDAAAADPVVMWADPARMVLSEYPIHAPIAGAF